MAMNLSNIIGAFVNYYQVDEIMEGGRQWAILHIEMITDVLQIYVMTPKDKIAWNI